MGRLRIIAGRLKGRRIRFPDTLVARPTAERVREALFSILGATVEGARVLDAYCGSGALGFEAASRGAGPVVFVDDSADAIDAVRENAERMGIGPSCRFFCGTVLDLVGQAALGEPFDLILADPPYGSEEGAVLARRAVEIGVLRPDGLLVVERDARVEPRVTEPGTVVRVRVARYGRTCLDFYRGAAHGGVG